MTKVLTKSGKVIKVVSHEEEKESMQNKSYARYGENNFG